MVATSWLLGALPRVLTGAGLPVLGLRLGGADWLRCEPSTWVFCQGLEEWHARQMPFLARANEARSRNKQGLPDTERMFYNLEDSVVASVFEGNKGSGPKRNGWWNSTCSIWPSGLGAVSIL